MFSFLFNFTKHKYAKIYFCENILAMASYHQQQIIINPSNSPLFR